jgi:hypothetical protein
MDLYRQPCPPLLKICFQETFLLACRLQDGLAGRLDLLVEGGNLPQRPR